MNAKRILGGALVFAAFAASAVAIAAPATTSKVGKFDVYADASRTGKFDTFSEGSKIGKYDTYTDGARQGKFDTFSEGSRQGKFDTFSEGSRTFSGEISASALDNARNGDLYGYRV
ncbi:MULTISPECIES: hypothetical protein [unclassified Cupriavidus]|uniref:hypothetical protein n=1 Tax=unclassified Cupriavidus TaxID=2640874 RepID=UPI000889A753|nr:hypothetical protein [Cupriavidus sp. YR651]SDD16295.1 hypothetical protein SAMN05216345_106265 [Cupriavidus sp. YR651]